MKFGLMAMMQTIGGYENYAVNVSVDIGSFLLVNLLVLIQIVSVWFSRIFNIIAVAVQLLNVLSLFSSFLFYLWEK